MHTLKRPLDYRLRDNLRRRLSKALKGAPREKAAHELLGCSFKHFKKHLESLFQEGMNWENYGIWEVDHYLPLMTFDLSKRGQQKKAFNYKNLRPLWGDDNRKRPKKIRPDGLEKTS